eukprot:5209986-Pleurochrysis_carterae.AAC.1
MSTELGNLLFRLRVSVNSAVQGSVLCCAGGLAALAASVNRARWPQCACTTEACGCAEQPEDAPKRGPRYA